MDRPLIKQQITFLSCPDLGAMDKFYGGVLGLEPVLDQGVCHIYHVAAGGYLGFCRPTTHLKDAQSEAVILTLVVDGRPDVDAWYAYLLSRNMTEYIEREPVYNPQYRIYHLFLRDPAGYLVEIQAFEDPAWHGRVSSET